jgi:DNA/RNA-binding protein KIN17
MPKHEPGTAAHEANRMKKSQKTKIRWYCGLCQVPCKDENGFKCHLESETHVLREQAVHESLRTFKLSKNDEIFRRKFLDYLVSKHFGQTVLAHDVYRDMYPIDRPQNLMKETCWETLGVFIAQLRKQGAVEAHKGVKGWQIRITSKDFEDEGSEVDSEEDKQTKVEKKRKETDEIELLSLKRIKEPETIESHSESSKRISGAKVSFALSKGAKFPLKSKLPSAFENDSSDDHS